MLGEFVNLEHGESLAFWVSQRFVKTKQSSHSKQSNSLLNKQFN